MQDLRDLIKSTAIEFGLSWELVHAICVVESSMDPYSFRHEPQYKYLYHRDPSSSLSPTERIGQMCSWGLMQVMGAVAREHGFTGHFPRLCDPQVGLRYGCLHLSKFQAKYSNVLDVIASYNAGSPRRADGEGYVNQKYVDKVLREFHVINP